MDVHGLGIRTSTDTSFAALLKTCYDHSHISKHPSTHTAALLVDAQEIVMRGANTFPPGVKELPERYESPARHVYPNHAERDAIYKAAKAGIKTAGLTMVMPWLPCISCANAIITSGITTLIVHKQMIERTDSDWVEELTNAVKILREAGVEIIAYDGIVGAKAYMHEQEWDA